ncbi:MAG TPA: dihydrodipicolinate synthase family protein [Chryseolinea sp.]|nr:dihydrodipicolinate synthase family protein [Chryseolinea sp.]
MKSYPVEILNAVFTPMFDDGSIHYERIPELFHHSIQTGADGIFLNGTTGECMSLSVLERQRLVEAWIEHRGNTKHSDFKIFAHVGSCNLYETAQMAEHAQSQGVNGIVMVSTFYFRPKSVEDLVEQCLYVAGAAPQTPFYYYNIPSLTGVNLPLIDFMELASKRIPNFAGLKNSFTDIVDYQHCIHFAKDKYSLYWGTDETFMMLYTAGNRRYVGSTYNYMPHVYRKMLEAYHEGDLRKVTKLQGEADAIYKVLLQYNGIAAGKEVMKFVGVDCGKVRKPLKGLTSQESENLLKKLKETTFFSHTVEKREPLSILK